MPAIFRHKKKTRVKAKTTCKVVATTKDQDPKEALRLSSKSGTGKPSCLFPLSLHPMIEPVLDAVP
jgi:hypothetical protein